MKSEELWQAVSLDRWVLTTCGQFVLFWQNRQQFDIIFPPHLLSFLASSCLAAWQVPSVRLLNSSLFPPMRRWCDNVDIITGYWWAGTATCCGWCDRITERSLHGVLCEHLQNQKISEKFEVVDNIVIFTYYMYMYSMYVVGHSGAWATDLFISVRKMHKWFDITNILIVKDNFFIWLMDVVNTGSLNEVRLVSQII